MDVCERLKEYVTLPLIGRGHRGRLIQAAMRDAKVEIERLRKIEAAATAWRRSLEGDQWTVEAIENDICRPGMADLLRLIPAGGNPLGSTEVVAITPERER